MRRYEMAQTVATSLFETEAAIDAALEKAGLLIALTASLRREHGLSAVLGHEGVGAIARLIEAVGQARGHAMVAHSAFAASAPMIGVKPATLHGTGVGKPDEDTKPTGMMPALHLVEATA
ncbi:hypothetical protein [Brevundimonas sp.]